MSDKPEMTTTFAELKKVGACAVRYRHLGKALGGVKSYGEATPITALQILEICGRDDCLWAAPLLPNDRLWRHFAADCAENVLHIYEKEYAGDDRTLKAIAAARDYADGKIDAAGSAVARDAVRAAAWDAGRDTVRAVEEAWQTERLRWYLTECDWGPKQGRRNER